MNQYTNAAQHYLEKQILNASPVERVVLCYDGAIKFLTLAKRAINEGNIQERFNNNKRACDIIAYLLETLQLDGTGQIGENLNSLYRHMLARLVDVDMRNDVTAIDDVINMLRPLNESWKKIASGEVSLNPAAATGADVSATDDESKEVKTRSAIA